MRRSAALVAVALALAVSGARAADPTPRLVTLKNGVRILLAPDSSAAAVDVAAWYPGGAGAEPAGRSGVAHVVEGLVMRASRAAAAGVLAAGGSTASAVAPDYATFYETGPPECLEAALRLEAERMKSLPVRPAELDAVRAAQLAERAARPATPEVRGVQGLYALLDPGLVYGRSAEGSAADVERLTARDCEDAFRSGFATSGALVTVVGRFDPARAEALASQAFGAVPARPAPAPRAASGGERRAAGGAPSTDRAEVELPTLFMGWRAPGAGDADAEALDLLGRILAGGAASRVSAALGGGAVQGGYDARRDGGLLFVAVAVPPGVDTAKVVQVVGTEMMRAVSAPAAAGELERAERQAESTLLFGTQTARGRAQSLGTAALSAGDWRRSAARLEALRALTAADLSRAAGRVLTPDRRATFWLLPVAGAAGGKP